MSIRLFVAGVLVVSSAGLPPWRADNVEPISGKPMSALYYDVDLEVARDVWR